MKNRTIQIAAPMLAVCMALSAPTAAYASQEDVAAVILAIDGLPSYEDLDESYADMVKNVWTAYNDLSMAEKITVSNSDKLEKEYKKFIDSGILKDEEKEAADAQGKLDAQRANEQVSDKNASQVTDYTFNYNPQNPISIVVRYTTYANGDGKGDTPERVTLTSPHADTYPVTNTNTKLSDTDLTVGLSWEDNFVQMDFANADEGKWTISTSIPCTFSAINYAGARQDIKPNGEQGEKQKETNEEETESADQNAEEQEESGGGQSTVKTGFGIAAIIGIIIGLIICFKKLWPKSSGEPTNPVMEAKRKREMENDEEIYEMGEPKPMTDDEVVAQMKAEYKASVEKQRQMDEADEVMSRNATVDEDDYTDLNEVTQEDLDNDETIEEYTEGDTGLLSQNDNPENKKSGNSFFDDEDVF